MKAPSACPKCKSENIYEDGNLWVCPECAHEWAVQGAASDGTDNDEPDAEMNGRKNTSSDGSIRDAHGNVLANGDSVIVIKDLKIKGSSSVVKSGTKVRNIRLADGGDGHDIACRLEGVGSINLKSEFVKKA